MGSKYGYKAEKKRPRTGKEIIRNGIRMTDGLHDDGYLYNLPTDTTVNKTAQAILDLLLSQPEMQEIEHSFDEEGNCTVCGEWSEDYKFDSYCWKCDTRNAERECFCQAIKRVMGMEASDE